jgi:hypothetical protein
MNSNTPSTDNQLELYRVLTTDQFPNWDQAREELERYITSSMRISTVGDRSKPWSYFISVGDLLNQSPVLHDALKQILRITPTEGKVYHSPPGNGTGPHKDGVPGSLQPLGLALPIIGIGEQSRMVWYRDDSSNEIIRQFDSDPLDSQFASIKKSVVVPRDPDKMVVWDQLAINRPTFVRNDIMHSVINQTDCVRVVLILRWHPIFKKFDDLMSVR